MKIDGASDNTFPGLLHLSVDSLEIGNNGILPKGESELGFLNSIKKRVRKSEIVQASSQIVEFEEQHSIAARLSIVPPDILRLLWFKDGPLMNYSGENFGESSFKYDGFTIRISFKGSSEPSAISIKDRIQRPEDVQDVEKLSYYPEYCRISPEQRWIYGNWLKKIDFPIDIGYVFIFYYGLERHLFFGSFEAAFDMILRLRASHKNGSFLAYSSSAMIASCILHNRADLFLKFLNSIDVSTETIVSGLYLLAKRELGMRMFAPEIMAVARDVDFNPRSYIRDQKELFEIELKKALTRIDEGGALDLRQFSLDCCPKKQEIIAANFSLAPEQRCLMIPDIRQHPDFRRMARDLLEQAHNSTKEEVRILKKSGALASIVAKPTQEPARQPDTVFKKSPLFDEIDVHVFDRDLRCFNESVCPYCEKQLSYKPSRKRKCEACGNTVLLKSSVFTGEKLLMTEKESESMAKLVKDRARRKRIIGVIASEGLHVDDIAVRVRQENKSIEVVILEEVVQSVNEHVKASDFGLARNSMLLAGEILERENELVEALRFYLGVCYFDLNGAMNSGAGFERDTGFIAPGVISMILDVAGKRNMDVQSLKPLFIDVAIRIRIPGMPLAPKVAWSKLKGELREE